VPKKIKRQSKIDKDFNRKTIIVSIFVIVIANTIAYIYFPLTNRGYPIVSFMTTKGRFDDFYNSTYTEFGSLINTVGNLTLHPLSVLIGNIFSIAPIDVSAVVFFVAFSGILFYALGKLSNSILIPIMVFVSYPYQFTIARGNNEIILVAVAALMYSRIIQKSYKQGFQRFIILNLVEPYPLYLFQFIAFKNQVKNQIKTYMVFALLLIVGALLSGTGRTYLLGLISEGRGNVNVLSPGTTLHSSSIGGTLEFLWAQISNKSFFEDNPINISLLLLQITGFFLLFIFFFKFKGNVDLVTSSILIICCWTLFNNPSFDYRLLHFFIPLSMMYYQVIGRKDLPILVLIILIILPKPYLFFVYSENPLGITLGSVINPILLILLINFTLIRFERNYRKIDSKNGALKRN
jgi:hypothetical protein